MYQGYNVAHASVFDLWLPCCICSKMQNDKKSESDMFFTFNQRHPRVGFKSLTVTLFSTVESV